MHKAVCTNCGKECQVPFKLFKTNPCIVGTATPSIDAKAAIDRATINIQ